MAGKGSKPRPAPAADETGTRQVRVNGDIGEMIGWIYEIEGVSSAVLLDPLVRPQVTARYERIRATVEKIKRRREEEDRLKAEARQHLRGAD
jgi:hypothetical protein